MGRYLSISVLLLSLSVIGCSSDATIKQDVEGLKYITSLPYDEPMYSGDERFWKVVKYGKEALPFLISKLDDDTNTDLIVYYVGGNYAIGDIALVSIWEIIRDIPVESLIEEPFRSKWEDIGVGAYFAYVRTAKENRTKFKLALKEWIEKNVDKLIWMAVPDHPAGGRWVCGKD